MKVKRQTQEKVTINIPWAYLADVRQAIADKVEKAFSEGDGDEATLLLDGAVALNDAIDEGIRSGILYYEPDPKILGHKIIKCRLSATAELAQN